ncbi:MerR family transcriptional regulator [Nonomuraea sp. NPDC049129]|uniref:MerR family transcriptional regulator n=1 Tax=Nonomuraea sp. NPDC049129 TaxID=3155272 RepID=UPI00340FC779
MLEVKPQPEVEPQPEPEPARSGPARSAPASAVSTRSIPNRSVPDAGLSIAEAARLTGISAHTLRYYERAGLVVTAVDRTAGGRRRYRKLDLEWITICTRLRATGMPIKAIRRYAELVSAGHGNEEERLALMEGHRADVLAKMAELQENLRLIDHKIDVYRGRLAAGDADQLWAPKSPNRQASDPPSGRPLSVL